MVAVTAKGWLDFENDSDKEYIWEIYNPGATYTYTWQVVGGESGSITLEGGATTFLFTQTLDDITLLDGATTVASANYINQAAPAPETMTTGADNVVGHDNNDNINGNNGNDTIDGAAGGDTINGGAGNDYITGGTVSYSEPPGAPAVISPSDIANITFGSGGNVEEIFDGSGNGNDAFQTNTALQPGLININGRNALDFDGVDDYLTIANSADINTSTGAERSIFMNFTTGADVNTRQYIYEEGGRSNGYSFYLFDGEVYVGAWKNNGNHFEYFFSTSIEISTTYTVGFVYDNNSNTFTAYVDGASIGVGAINYDQAAHSGNITMGANGGRSRNETGQDNTNSPHHYFQGQIGDYALYNTALNAAEVAELTSLLSHRWGNAPVSEDDSLSGGAGHDTIEGGIGDDTIDGGTDNDTLHGDDGNDNITGGSGNDSINGGAEHDTLYGNDGDDSIIGGTGNDTIDGGNNNDTISGGGGNDSLSGGGNEDTIDGGDGADTLNGGNDFDWVDGDAGNDSINGGAGDDWVTGGTGADTVSGGDGDDIVADISFDATAFDTGPNDVLYGNAGNDYVVSTGGQDSLWGGTGNDIFYFPVEDAVIDAEIKDFVQGEDHIELGDITDATGKVNVNYTYNFGDLTITQVGGNTHIQGFANGSDIEITGFTGTLTADDFII